MGWGETILLKGFLRSDRIWTHPIAYRSFLRYIPLFMDTLVLMRSQYWARYKIERIQEMRVKNLIAEAVSVPFWRDRLAGISIDDPASALERLCAVPVSSKEDLVDRGMEYRADASLLSRSNPDQTSGSTGKPFSFYQDWHASLRSFAVVERTFRATGKRYPIVYIRARERNGFTFYKHIWFFLRTFSSWPYRIDAFLHLARSLKRGFILYSYTSWVAELARLVEARGVSVPMRAVVVAGEHLSEGQREHIEKVFRCELFTLYASREVGFIGFECKEHNLHINEEWAYVEIVDQSGRRLPAGEEGRIIVTTFDNRVMPFIRYDIGDIGSISKDPCMCGRTLRTLNFRGRTSELIHLDDGRTISLLDIAYAIGHFRDTVRQYQIVQTAPMSFTIRIVPGPLYELNRLNIDNLMMRLLHPRAQVEWEIVDEIAAAESGKAVYFVRTFSV